MTPELVKGIARQEIREVTKIRLQEIITTDATPTLLFYVDTRSTEKGLIEYTVNALKDDGLTGLSIRRIFGYKNDGTTLTITSETDILNDNDFTTADVAANVNSETIEVKVTGEAATNISWVGTYEQEKINVEVLAP